MRRVLTSIGLSLFALYSIFWAPQWLFAIIVAAMGCLCYTEYARIAAASGVQGPLWAGFAAGLIAMVRPESVPLLILVLLSFALASSDLTKALGFAGSTALGIVYIFVGWRWAVDLRALDRFWLLFALSINWVGDVAAYYVGRAIGRHKLAPRISPGKSWEGAIASLAAAVAFGVWYGPATGLAVTVGQMAILSVAANVAGQVGDLAESALKRGAGVKDSGTLLPGHGGFLDRLDSSLFTLPVVYFLLLWSGWRGV